MLHVAGWMAGWMAGWLAGLLLVAVWHGANWLPPNGNGVTPGEGRRGAWPGVEGSLPHIISFRFAAIFHFLMQKAVDPRTFFLPSFFFSSKNSKNNFTFKCLGFLLNFITINIYI